MLKKILLVIIFIGLISIPFFNNYNKIYSNTETVTKHSKSIEINKLELYQDIYITMLDPYIRKSIKDFYGKPYSYDLFQVKVLRIYRPYGYRTFTFLLKIQLKPFVGAHNTIGIDNITFRIEPGIIKVQKFEHIRSFEPLMLKRIRF